MDNDVKQILIDRLMAIIKANPGKATYIDPDNPSVEYLDWSKLSDNDRLAIKSFKSKRGVHGRNANKVPIYVSDVEFHDVHAAIEKLAKLLGLYEPDKSEVKVDDKRVQETAALLKRVREIENA